jgi:hypothetical protein
VYNSGPDFLASSDTTHHLTVGQAGTTTAAGDATATFASVDQSVTLRATVSPSGGVGTVTEGTVTFRVYADAAETVQVGSSVTSGTVDGTGHASADYTLPGGTVAGTYYIKAVYNSGPDFLASSDTTHHLTVGQAGTTTAAGNASAVSAAVDQGVNLSAVVSPTNGIGQVTEGAVTFTVYSDAAETMPVGSPVTSGAVDSTGHASATYTLPGGSPAGTYFIKAAYNPGNDFTASTDTTHTLAVLALIDTGLSVPAGTTAGIGDTNLHVSDTGVAASSLTYTVGTAPAQGTLLRNGQALGAGGTFTQADVDGGLLSYQCTATAPGSDSFTFTLSDGTHGTTAPQTFAITITRPLATVVSITRDGTTPTNAGSVSWDVTFSTAVAGLSASDLALVVGPGLGGAPTITGVSPSSGAATTFTVTASTGTGGAGSLGLDVTGDAGLDHALTNTLPVVSPSYAVDHTPPTVTADGPLTVTAVGPPQVLTSAALEATDPDDGPTDLTFTVVTPPAHGTLRDGTTVLGAGGTFTQADVNSGLVTYSTTDVTDTADGFTFTVHDLAGNATGLQTFSIAVAVTPSFSALSAPTIVFGTPSVTLSGNLRAGTVAPSGSVVSVTLHGVTQSAPVRADGSFSAVFATGSLPAGSYAVGYSFAGAGVFLPAGGTGTLTVTYGTAVVGPRVPLTRAGVPLPLWVEVLDASGHNVGSLVVTAVGVAPAANPSAIWPARPHGTANPGNRLMATPGSYLYLLDATGLAAGQYLFSFTVQGDPVEHSVLFQVL